MSLKAAAIAALALLFAFRLFFGLSSLLFTEDETQIYLLGLRFHASQTWPYFGPDVVWTETQIPGALQALLVGLPFSVAAIPEAPYVLLNVLSFGALALFAWYIGVHLPGLPKWLVWGWLFTLPWTLELSTHIINPSYVLPASVVFFIGFFESIPALRTGRVPLPLCYASMGLALGWVAQVHMSWPLLLPFIGVASLASLRDGLRTAAVCSVAFALGLAVTGSFMVPTWMQYGFQSGGGGTSENVFFHWREPVSTFVKTLARLLSFSTYEINRFIATGSARQIVFLQDNWWLVVPALSLWAVGLVHPLWMALTAFRRRSTDPRWSSVRWLLVATVSLVSLSFFFTVAWAQARSFYVVAPVSFMYAAYCWRFVDSPRARRIAAAVLVVNVGIQASLAISRLTTGPSLYMSRALVAEAIQTGAPDMFAHRRPWGRDVTPDSLASSKIGANATGDIVVERADRLEYFRGLVSWRLLFRNRSAHYAYRDLLCETTYYDARGEVVETHREPVWLVLQPGEARSADLVDSARWASNITGAEVRIVDAQALRPLAAFASARATVQ